MTSVAAQVETAVSHDRVLHAAASVHAAASSAPDAARWSWGAAADVWLRLGTDLAAAALSLGLLHLVSVPLPPVMAAVFPLLWLAVLTGHRAHARRNELLTGIRVRRVLQAGLTVGFLAWTTSVLVGQADRSESLLLLTATVTATTLLLRFLASSPLVRRGPLAYRRRTVVVGCYSQVREALDELRRTPEARVEVVAVCLFDRVGRELFDVPVIGDITGLGDLVAASAADAVVVLPSDRLGHRDLQRLGWQLEKGGTAIYVGSGLLDVTAGRITVGSVGGLHLVHVRPARRLGARWLVKQLWERGAAAVLVVTLAPMLLALGWLVRLDSSGPALFRQTRIGRDGRPFTILKYRTMNLDADALAAGLLGDNDCDGVLFKLRRDPRVTRVGRVLRRYSLDELPQLLNVAAGQMALIGPRPALPGEVDRYDHDPRRRLAVRPGLTGLWQVSGRSDLSWEESVRLDLLYVDNWSLTLDLTIVARTAGAVLRARGAY